MPASLRSLSYAITRCERCPRLRAHCRGIARVRKREFAREEYWGRPVPSLGDPHARLLIVGLAPAAHGANRTGQMFTGDSSGSWLYEALHRYGWANHPNSLRRDDGLVLTDCWITAAAHCAPPDNKPTREELANCRPWLAAELARLDSVEVVLTLGRIAWESWLRAAGWWDRLSPRDRPPFAHGAESVLPDGKRLMTSFHPSRQNTNTGKLTRDMWYRIFERIRTFGATPSPRRRGQARGGTPAEDCRVVRSGGAPARAARLQPPAPLPRVTP
jgi:uracil-DNA glycosylase family 4